MIQKIRQIFSANSSIDTSIQPEIDNSYQETMFFQKRVNKSVARNKKDLTGRIIIISQQQQPTRSATPMTQSTSSSNSSKPHQRQTIASRMILEISSDYNNNVLDQSFQHRQSLQQNQQEPRARSRIYRNDPKIIQSTQYQCRQIGSSQHNEKIRNSRFRSPFRFNRVLLKLKPRRFEDLSELYLEQYNKWQSQTKQTCTGERDTTGKQISSDGIIKINADFLKGHQITHYQRSKMVDWMYLVFSKFNRSESQTIFRAVNILDQYLKMKQEEQVSLDINDLHLYGLVSIFMSSKINDVVPIYLKELIHEASHNVFTGDQIKTAEQKILKALQFRINVYTVYESTAFKVKEIFLKQKQKHNKDLQVRVIKDQKDIESLIELLSKLSLLDFGICMLNDGLILDGIIICAFGIQTYLKQQFKAHDQKCSHSDKIDDFTILQAINQNKDQDELLSELFNDYANDYLIYGKLLTPIIKRLLKTVNKLFEGKLKFKILIGLYPQYSKLHLDTNEIMNLIQQYLK